MRKRQHSGFTLVELLSVVLIMGILLAIGIPMLTAFRASAVSAGARSVGNALHLARQYAVTHRTRTRVIFSLQTIGQEKAFNTFSVAAMPTNTVSTWKVVGRWESLPLGAAFGDSTAPHGSLESLPTHSGNYGMGTRRYAYIEFLPTGAANPPFGNWGTISVYEGTVTPDGMVRYAPGGNRADVIYDRLLGRVRIQRP
ncbi:MAG: prepilin-type N-terminal cleavage/methylation domain-containing protein [Verrucomicrobiae bacterium]|nr:prepilin-type N-terminal cleavage/methylation domain-containing protein [Verrucomicrobiae bacterium]